MYAPLPRPSSQPYRDVVALSNGGAEQAGHHTADVQQWHTAAPAMVSSCLTLHAGEAEKTTATLTAKETE